jgi:hypothetical protein
MNTITLDNKTYPLEQLSTEAREYVLSISLTKKKMASLQSRIQLHQEVRKLYLQKLKTELEAKNT